MRRIQKKPLSIRQIANMRVKKERVPFPRRIGKCSKNIKIERS